MVLPKTAVGAAVNFDTVILAMAMAALGVTTQVSAIRTAGIKPLALAALLFAWLVLGGAAINALARTGGIELKVVDVGVATPLPPPANRPSECPW